MSLLEDVFLEDEADEAQELERIIERDEFDESSRVPPARSDSDDNSEREDEAEEEKRRVDPSSTKSRTRVNKNPRFILNPARLTGPRGIQVIPEHFKDFKFRGKGHEKDDLDLVLKKLEHWAYRLYPKFKFEDCLKKIETLGKKRPVMVHLHKIRSDQYLSEETVVQRDSSDDEAPPETPPEDEFDKLLQQQIDLARSTPAPQASSKGNVRAVKENRPLIMPKATSSPSISEEQRERILRSKKLAEERLAKLKNMKIAQNNNSNFTTPSKSNSVAYTLEKISENENEAFPNDHEHGSSQNEAMESTSFQKNTPVQSSVNENEMNKVNIVNTENVFSIEEENDVGKPKKVRANVIDSSDEDDDIVVMNESIRVDVHTNWDENDDDGKGHTIMKQDPKNDGYNVDDDLILNDEIYDGTKGGQQNNNFNCCEETENSTENHQREKCNSYNDSDVIDEEDGILILNDNDHTNVKERSSNVDGPKNNQSVTDFNKDSEIHGSDKECNNLDDNDEKENAAEMILSEIINTNPVSHKNDKVVEIDKKSPKASLQQIEDIEDSVEREKCEDITNVPEKAIVDSVDELMDVDFEDDF